MTDPRHDRERDAHLDPQVDAATESMLSQMRACYGPAPLEPARRAALERRLARRLEDGGPRWRMGAPLLVAAMAAAAAAMIWLRLPASVPAAAPEAAPGPVAVQPIAAGTQGADNPASDAWVAQLFDPPELGEAPTVQPTDQDRSLYPADLAAIDVAFLGN